MSADIYAEVFSCRHCEGSRLPFVRSAVGKDYRFPPIIGATGNAPLLFVGINPRVSPSNQWLHDSIVNDPVRFSELARNRVGADKYIGTNGLERHYRLHNEVAASLFPGQPFEAIASVTELHFCASKSSVGLPYAHSRCAERYFASVLEIVRPTVVFAVGQHVLRTLRAQYPNTSKLEPKEVLWPSGSARLILLSHPNAWGTRKGLIESATLQARELLHMKYKQKAL